MRLALTCDCSLKPYSAVINGGKGATVDEGDDDAVEETAAEKRFRIAKQLLREMEAEGTCKTDRMLAC